MDIEQVIGQVERLYQSVTGRAAPQPGHGPYAPIPPERNPEEYVNEQLDRLLERLGSPLGPKTAPSTADPAQQAGWVPALSVWEGEDELVFLLDLPGVAREDVSVSLQRGALSVAGESRGPRPRGAGAGLHSRWIEGPVGPFHRAIPLPASVAGEVDARLVNGVLEIRISKRSQTETARVVPVG